MLEQYFENENTAMVTPAGRVSYKSLRKKARAWQKALERFGPQQVIAYYAPTLSETIELFYAILLNNQIALPLNPQLPELNIQQITGQNRIAAMIPDPSRIELEALPGQESTREIATLVATSGSTGSAKLVAHTLKNHFYSALGSKSHIPFTREDNWLLSLPLYHISGIAILFRCLFSSAAVTLTSASWQEAVMNHDYTHVSLVPSQLQAVLQTNEVIKALKNRKCILVGGAGLSQGITAQALDNGLPLVKTYGSTEMASQVTSTRQIKDLETSGSILPYREVSIAGGNEILLRGATLSPGYFSENTLLPLVDKDGWFHSNDCGFIDPEKRLTITGRLDNMFTSGGYNIHCEEIESAIMNTAMVEKCIVLPVEDEMFGHRPVAFIHPHNEKVVATLQKIMARHLHKYKIPDEILALPEELFSQLKISRSSLKEIAQKVIKKKELP